MNLNLNILLKLFLFSSIASIVAGCSHPGFNQQEEQDDGGYREKIIALKKKVDQLPKYCDPANFIPIYKEAIPLLEFYSDTSYTTAEARSTFIQKLIDMGITNQAMKQTIRALKANQIRNITDSVLTNQLLYGKLISTYKKKSLKDSVFATSQIAIDNAKKHPDKLWLASTLNNTGYSYSGYGQEKMAKHYFLLADSILESKPQQPKNWNYFQGIVRTNLAQIYIERYEFEKARKIYAYNFYKRFLRKDTKNRAMRVKAGTKLANTEITLGNFNEAKNILNQVGFLLDTLEHPDKLQIEVEFFKTRIKLSDATGNKIKGLVESKQLISLQNSLMVQKEYLKNRIYDMMTDFTSEQFENIIQQEKKARLLYEQKADLRLWVIFLMILSGLVTTILLVRSNRQRVKLLETDKLLEKEKQQHLSLQLENKKKDLTNMAISLQHKQQWARDLNEQMQKVILERGQKRSRELKKLQREIKRNVFVDKNMELIQQNIDILSNEFYEKLNNLFPNLTKGETKLCSYIKLNLDNMQIAQLQNVDSGSVKISRYRLKKKLGIGPDQNLDNYIQNLGL